MDNQTAAILRQISAKQAKLDDDLRKILEAVLSVPPSLSQEIDKIPGRRLFFHMSANLPFTATDAGSRGEALNFIVSSDGPFVMTHYPCISWKPNSPDNAENFGRWSPVFSSPLPVQQVTNLDTIDLSYEINDGGTQRMLQNSAALPISSRLDNPVPLPVPSFFKPNAVVAFIPTFDAINFNNSASPATEGGVLRVTMIGFRAINM